MVIKKRSTCPCIAYRKKKIQTEISRARNEITSQVLCEMCGTVLRTYNIPIAKTIHDYYENGVLLKSYVSMITAKERYLW